MRALVVGGADIRGSLTAVRALARAGWTVGVGSPQPGVASYSNCCTRWHFVPSPKDSLAAFIDAVNSAGEQNCYGVVFGGGDDEVLALSGARRELGMTVPYASHTNVLRALDKLKLHEAARRVGVATPRTLEADRVSREAVGATVVVKPNIHWTPGCKAGTSRFAAIVTSQHDTVQRRSREILDAGRTPLIQEFIPGQLLAFIAITDRRGNILTGFS
ncbi:MAG: hypothetical protein M3346_03110, partial [Actinomycetota bacterium]|nr:hypothetical protein [Actinomycetota bacterium]